VTIANEDEDNDDQDSDNFLTKSLHNKKLKKNKKLIFKATSADLNSSSSSNTSSDGLSGSKPQYTLVNNGSGGGSGSGSGSSTSGATSNTTLMYRDPEDDDFVLTIASPTNTFKKKQQQHQVTTTSVTSLKPPHPRFVYSPASLVLTAASNRLHSFENHRLNSAADSFDTAADTTIDDSKSSCGRSSTSNPDYELTNISQIKTESSLSTATSLANTTMNKYEVKMTTTPRSHLSEHSHSSAYGSISNSENIVSDTEIRNNINNNVSL
jgi:hypothetical protein